MEDITSDLSTRYLPFLVEIRKRVLFIACLFVIGTVLGFIFNEAIIRAVMRAFNFGGINIVFTSPFQFIELTINSSLLVGLIIALPVIIYQILAFAKPALKHKEYRVLILLIPLSLVLFLLGFCYGVLMMRSTLEIFYNQTQELGVGNILDIIHFFSLTVTTSILMGLAFQFPIFLTLLMHFKLLSHKVISRMRIFFYFGCLIFVIFLPPTDLFSDFLLVLPLVVLFELTLFLNRVALNRKK